MTRLLIHERPLLVQPKLAVRFGLKEAIVLQQIHWASGRDTAVELDGRRWVKVERAYMLEHWFPFLSESGLDRALAHLKTAGVLLTSRGREGNTYAVIEESPHLDDSRSSHRPVETPQTDESPCKREEEERELPSGAGAPGGDQLFATGDPDPSPSKPDPAPDPYAAACKRIWDRWISYFEQHHRVKTLTDARRKMLKSGLNAVGGKEDLEAAVLICLDAVDAYKAWHDDHSGAPVKFETVFSYNPTGGKTLTDQIDSWASNISRRSGSSDNLHSHAPAIRDKVKRHRLTVVEMYQQPHLSGVRERGESALTWLKEQANEEPIIEGDPPRITGWRNIA